MMAAPLEVLSIIIGWTYFFLWSFSFYGQVVLNFRRKRVDGLSMDFTWLNSFGHGSYAVFTTAMFFSAEVRRQYREHNDGHDSSVRANDVAFAVHAFTLATITLLQTFWYPRAPDQRLSNFNRILLLAFGTFCVVDLTLVASRVEQVLPFLNHLSYFKLYVSIAKYVPQAWLNYQRKSTVGWSISNILLDFSGGVLSLAQLFLDSWLARDWTSITGNPVKFGLSFLSILFDMLFILQHYVFYRHTREKPDMEGATETAEEGAVGEQLHDEQTPLLRDASSRSLLALAT
ncbi:cystinosin [Dacryopinax primogenitus]|uniref:Cystinosin n=1 Tax=Dacryopinax primogenitus (strain DJM 731) TaxID=1858805 RepID=M5FW52_DACPD|nr:cystinosin [Dacryopinax primogenitus]EJT97601.1 cystinosin [Dacryopinax primogenitus]